MYTSMSVRSDLEKLKFWYYTQKKIGWNVQQSISNGVKRCASTFVENSWTLETLGYISDRVRSVQEHCGLILRNARFWTHGRDVFNFRTFLLLLLEFNVFWLFCWWQRIYLLLEAHMYKHIHIRNNSLIKLTTYKHIHI